MKSIDSFIHAPLYPPSPVIWGVPTMFDASPLERTAVERERERERAHTHQHLRHRRGLRLRLPLLLGRLPTHGLEPPRSIGPIDNLVGDHQPGPRRSLHGIQIILVRVRSRQEEILHVGRLRRTMLILPGLFSIEGLSQFDDVGPGAVEFLRGRKEGMKLIDAILHDPIVRSRKGPFVEHGLNETPLPLLVIFSGTGEGQIGEAGEFGVGRIQEVVDAGAPSVRLIPGDVHHETVVVHFGHPSVEPHLHGGDGDAFQVINVIEHGIFAERFREDLLDSGNVEGGDDDVEFSQFVVRADANARDAGGLPVVVDVVLEIATPRAQINLDVPFLQIFQNGIVQVRLGAALEHAEHGRLGADREQHEDGQHASRGNVIAIDEPQRVRDGVPHAIEGSSGSSQLSEPFREGHIVEIADHVHPPVEIEEGPHDRAGTEADGVVELIDRLQLFRLEEGLKSRDGRPYGELKIEGSQMSALVHEGMNVFLQSQRLLEFAGALHDTEQVVIASEEHVQSHLDVIPVLIDPRADLPPDERTQFEHFDVVPGVGQIHGGDHAGEARADDSDLEPFGVRPSGAVPRSSHEIFVQEGIVSDLFLRPGRFDQFVDGVGGRLDGRGGGMEGGGGGGAGGAGDDGAGSKGGGGGEGRDGGGSREGGRGQDGRRCGGEAHHSLLLLLLFLWLSFF
mmetsp:Transcript_63060/g.186277  ORF Transcript_63060/g.186277 Transcript_63060/m.186277 type:complete len:678 (+) Transcript_63060:2010-4043(+)